MCPDLIQCTVLFKNSIICDPLWEKVPFGANIDFQLCAKKLDGVLRNILYDRGENDRLASTFSRRNEVDLPLVAPAVVVALPPHIGTRYLEITRAEGFHSTPRATLVAQARVTPRAKIMAFVSRQKIFGISE